MTVPYVTVAQVKNAMRSSYDGSDDALITSQIIPAACDFVDGYCNRASGGFAVQNYDELYNGSGDRILFLNNYPLQSINRLATAELPACLIHNTDSDMGTRATVQIIGTWNNNGFDSTGITLTYIKSAVTTTNTLLWANYPTVNDLVAAINAAGSNWTAIVQGGFGTWSSADLRATQGAFGARITSTYLWIHWHELFNFRVNEKTGEIYSIEGFARGVFNWRVSYSAGYSTFPNDLTQAICELAAATYYSREINANTTSETIGAFSYSQLAEKTFDGMSLLAKKTFQRYKSRKVPHFSTW